MMSGCYIGEVCKDRNDSRARCAPPRKLPSRSSSLLKDNLKRGSTHYQPQSNEVILDHYLSEAQSWDSYSPTYQNTLESAADMFPQNQFMWETDANLALESFQDLSEFIQSPVESNCKKEVTAAGGNMSVSLDDELNTPEIGRQEPFFEDSTRLIQFPLGDDWPVGVNTRPGTFDLSIAEVAQEQRLELEAISPENATVNLYSPKQEKIGGDEVISEHTTCYPEDLNIIVEREETVEMLPSESVVIDNFNSDIVKTEPISYPGLQLSFPTEPVKYSGPNTPDVLRLLDPCEFDLVNFIMRGDGANPEPAEPTTDFSAVTTDFSAVKFSLGDALLNNQPETENEETMDRLSMPEPTSESLQYKQEDQDSCEPSTSYSVVSQGHKRSGSHLTLTIKREPERTRSSRNRRISYRELVKDSDDEEGEEEYEAPSQPKRKKRSSPSCSTEGDYPCARYRELRDRNNEASRRSRQSRKAREEEMKGQAEVLERENRELKVKCEELERQLNTFRQLLVEIISSRKSGDKK